MSCECDIHIFPEPLVVPAGLETLARQIATLPEWRTATLAAIGRERALDAWNTREPDDLGLMLVDLWAYVCDVISFYDGATAGEGYLRPAQLRASRRKLVGLLGYVPRPAVASMAHLAVLAEGRKTVSVAAGTAFRSGSFSGNPPQVFELSQDASVHPLTNRWTLARVVPTQLDALSATVAVDGLSIAPGTLRAAAGDTLAILVGSTHDVRGVSRVDTVTTLAKQRFMRIVFDTSLSLPGTTTYASISLKKPTARAGIWTRGAATGEEAAVGTSYLILDGLHRGIGAGQQVIITFGSTRAVRTVSAVAEPTRVLLTGLTSSIQNTSGTTTGSLVSPDIKVQVTKLTFTQNLPAGATASATSVWYGLVTAGRIVAQPKDTLAPADPITIAGVIETPPVSPGSVMLVDLNGDGVNASAQIDFATQAVSLASDATWNPAFTAPVTMYGNAVTVTRGETVTGETIGIGDASQTFQTFKLAKKPLTYLSATGASGLTSTLDIHVDGIRWTEAASFYGADSTDRIFIVRADDDENTLVTFGGGARLPTGSRVVADYRYGAGAASPPAGSIAQLAKPVKGLKSVTNPLAAYGGGDREGSEELLAYAPRSALLLGRAVSLLDFEAAAAGVQGVRAVSTEWRFGATAQRPLAHISYIGDTQLRSTVMQRLRGLSDPTVPLAVECATGDATQIDLAITVLPEYDSAMVLNDVRDRLFAEATTPGTGGLLRPERLGIGKALFESHISEAVVHTEGVASLDGVLINGAPFTSYGILPPAGHYFDFESGAVRLNGSASYV